LVGNVSHRGEYREAVGLPKRREGFAILLFEPLPFPPFPKLNERHCAENEQAQYYEYDEAIRRRRHIFWQALHNASIHSGRIRRIDLDQIF
jgi:hypothetical protein